MRIIRYTTVFSITLFALSACVPNTSTTSTTVSANSFPSAAEPSEKKEQETQTTTSIKPIDTAFLRDLIETGSFRLGYPSRIKPLPDGSKVLFLRSQARSSNKSLYTFDTKTAVVEIVATPEDFLSGNKETLSPEEKALRERMRIRGRGFTSFQISLSGKEVLLGLSGHVYLLTLSSKEKRLLAKPDSSGSFPFDTKLSPDGNTLAFVRGGELWVTPVKGGKEKRLTSGASQTKIHAQAEFVAQEEMGRYTGYWWSPDSRFLVYQETDTSEVESVYLGDPAKPTRSIEPMPYPRPGKNNVKVRLGVIRVTGGKTTWLDWDQKRYPYLTRVVWQENSPLTILVQTRDQKDLSLLVANTKTGKTNEILHEHDDIWLNLKDDYRWLKDGSGFFWSTERNGAWQLELYNAQGTLQKTLTQPSFGFRGIRHIKAKAREVIVIAGATPIEQTLYTVSFDGGEPKALLDNKTFNNGTFSKSDVYVLSRTDSKTIYEPEVRTLQGAQLGMIPSVAEKPPFLPKVEIAKVGEEPGFFTALVRPKDFDPKKRYPVLVRVYGGPHANLVRPSASSYLRDQWIADHGFLVAIIDGRGTPRRGRDWERQIFGKFFRVPLEDQVKGLKALAKKEPAMDLGRVGIIGHSFGGYMAALSVLLRPDIFRAGVASAPVADWLDYDTHYTERYLGVPKEDSDYQLYQKNGLLAYADLLSNPLLIIHGTADDNVHFSQALKLADTLFRAGKPFELVTLAGLTHMLSADKRVAIRYWERVFRFFQTNL